MPKCTIDGKEIEVEAGTTVIVAAQRLGIEIPHFCWHPDLPVDGNCRMCLVEIEKMPKLQIACNTQVTDGMVVFTKSEKAIEAHRTTLELLLINHPIDCPVCDQAGECYLQDTYMAHGLHESQVEIEEKVRKRKVMDLGPIVLDAERCVLCSRCIRFEREVTKTNLFQFVARGDRTQIATYRYGSVDHQYSGNLADVCPVGALLSRDFRFKMRVWFLKEHLSVCPGCSTGCNIFVDERDGEVQRLRPRRNPEVNRSWMCDPGRALYQAIAAPDRLTTARVRGRSVSVAEALDEVAEALRGAAAHSAFVASPQATNEDLFTFRTLADLVGGRLDFRVGSPETRVDERIDEVLQRADRNPNTRGCLQLGLGRDGIASILSADLSVLVLQGPELLRAAEAEAALAKVRLVAVFATHDEAALARAHIVLPAASWAEVEGTYTNFSGRVQRAWAAVPPPGEATARWELAAGLLRRLGSPLAAQTAREVFALLAGSTPAFGGLDYQAIGASGIAPAPPAEPMRA